MSVLSFVFVVATWLHHIVGSNGFGIRKESRAEDASRIIEYEWIDIKYSDESGLLSFDSFGETFSLLLSKNERLVANKVRFGGDGIPDNSIGHITSLTSSCHYFVDEIMLSGKKLDYSGGGLSMCNKRGLRAHFWDDDEEYIIKPASFYFGNMDEHIDNPHYRLNEKHVIYKESKYNYTGKSNCQQTSFLLYLFFNTTAH